MAKSAKKSQLMEICLPNSRNNVKIIMVRNVRAYISDRQEQMQRIVSYISFQRIPGEQPGIFCVAEAAAAPPAGMAPMGQSTWKLLRLISIISLGKIVL